MIRRKRKIHGNDCCQSAFALSGPAPDRCMLSMMACYNRIGPAHATALRHELSALNLEYARHYQLEFRQTKTEPPVVCYLPLATTRHGNFLDLSYRAILKNPQWRRRLDKPHTSAWEILPREGLVWRELDSCNSSDALLMNIFCYPATFREKRVLSMLDVAAGLCPQFGIRAGLPLINGHLDRTEIDMQLGDLWVEAKLTESDFQRKAIDVVEGYQGFREVFDGRTLPRQNGCYLSYQLIRNVLAAYARNGSFCLILDSRRPDLKEAWFQIMASIRIGDLRRSSKILTWQELAQVLPGKLQNFLAEKYGIGQAFSRKKMAED